MLLGCRRYMRCHRRRGKHELPEGQQQPAKMTRRGTVPRGGCLRVQGVCASTRKYERLSGKSVQLCLFPQQWSETVCEAVIA